MVRLFTELEEREIDALEAAWSAGQLPLTAEELTAYIAGHYPDLYSEPPEPDPVSEEHAEAVPRSAAKVELMAARYDAGRQLFRDDDPELDDRMEWVVEAEAGNFVKAWTPGLRLRRR